MRVSEVLCGNRYTGDARLDEGGSETEIASPDKKKNAPYIHRNFFIGYVKTESLKLRIRLKITGSIAFHIAY